MSDKERAYFKKSTNDLLRAIAGEEPEADPMYNEETNAIIAAIKENGGSSLPDVTATDNGMVLTVVDGEWDKANASGGGASGLVVHDSSGTLDKTWQEIWDVFSAGGSVVVLSEIGDEPDVTTNADGVNRMSEGMITIFTSQKGYIASSKSDYPVKITNN